MSRPRRSVPLVVGLAAAAASVCLAARLEAQIVEVEQFHVADRDGHMDVAAGADGNAVFIWTETGSTPAADRIYTRAISPSGAILTEPTRVDVSGRLTYPVIAPLPGGGYAAAFWHEPAGPGREVQARRLDALGAGVGDLVRVDGDPDPSGSPSRPRITVAPSGPIVVWPEWFVLSRRLNSSLLPLAAGQQVSAAQVGFSEGGVEALAGGGHVVVWRDIFTDANWFRLYDAGGNALGPERFAGDGFNAERVAANPLGGFAIAGFEVSQVWVSRFDAAGNAFGSPILVADLAPARYPGVDIAYDEHGNLYVLWGAAIVHAQTGNVIGYTAQRAALLDASTGAPVGPPVDVGSGGPGRRVVRLQNSHFLNAWGRNGIQASIVSACGVNLPTCGDGDIDLPCEGCDDGAANSDTIPDACRTTCRLPACGDGVLDSAEECDDGGRAGGDGCDQNCLIEFCGNGRTEANEACDDGSSIDGDGCDTNCTLSACGNGIIGGIEECEDGNIVNGDGCDVSCLIEECPSGRIEGDERCDDGNFVEGDGCDSNCTFSTCGNGVMAPGEECDDGNTADGDGCDRACRVETCGNGRLEGLEQCDDSNLEDGDGCQADCTLTPRIDGVAVAPKPLRVVLGPTSASAEKRARITVRNGEASGLQILRLVAGDGTCPPGTVVGGPDFSRAIDGVQDSVALTPGGKATATLTLRFARASFPGPHLRVPRRCLVSLDLLPQAGAVDREASNNAAVLVVDVFDKAAPRTEVAESYVRTAKPLSLRIPNGALAFERTLRVVARSAAAGASFAFTLDDGDCPPGTLTLADANPNGRAKVRVRASRAFVTTIHPASPSRCTGSIAATTAQPDGEPGNDTTPIVVDAVDLNDL